MPKIVKRGEFYWADLSLGRGSEQMGLRPVLIVQNDAGNRYSPTTVIATCTTAKIRPYPFVVYVSTAESALPKPSTIDLSSLATVDKSRLGSKCGELGPDKMAEVDVALMRSLSLDRFIPFGKSTAG